MDNKEVEKIYRLSNLSLDGKDVEVISKKFNTVIDFIEDIFIVDTDKVNMTEILPNHKTVFRKDVAIDSVSREKALENARDTEFGYFRLDWKL